MKPFLQPSTGVDITNCVHLNIYKKTPIRYAGNIIKRLLLATVSSESRGRAIARLLDKEVAGASVGAVKYNTSGRRDLEVEATGSTTLVAVKDTDRVVSASSEVLGGGDGSSVLEAGEDESVALVVASVSGLTNPDEGDVVAAGDAEGVGTGLASEEVAAVVEYGAGSGELLAGAVELSGLVPGPPVAADVASGALVEGGNRLVGNRVKTSVLGLPCPVGVGSLVVVCPFETAVAARSVNAGVARRAGVGSVGVSVRVGNGVVVIAVPVASVVGVGRVPRLGVHGAVLSYRLVVLVEHVSGEELASLPEAVSEIELGSGSADSGTLACIERSVCEETHAHVSVAARAVERGADSSSAKVFRLVEASCRSNGAVYITVATGNDNVELVAPLAIVGGSLLINWATPEDTLDLSGRGGIGA